jgi:hypothetical protein
MFPVDFLDHMRLGGFYIFLVRCQFWCGQSIHQLDQIDSPFLEVIAIKVKHLLLLIS